MSDTIIHWYRLDLRVRDLPSLAAAARNGSTVLPVYILDEQTAGDWARGGASRWWLHHSLDALSRTIEDAGGSLLLKDGDSAEILKSLCEKTGSATVHCTRRYEPWAARQEESVHSELEEAGITLKRFPGNLLQEPGKVLTQAEEPYKVFTPFWRACRQLPVAEPQEEQPQWMVRKTGKALDSLGLTPSNPDWAQGWETLWTPGENGAELRLREFLDGPVENYAEGRNIPGDAVTSRLSPHLHNGEISPRQIWAACEAQKVQTPENEDAITKFQSELGWREFSYHLLHFFPHMPESTFREQFADFPWVSNAQYLKAWQRGATGYPIVDAGMRELWHTGYMHNRVRMVVASFLCKHLLQHWRHGEDWFWDTLVDADLANNGCSWQWVAGSGADAAPYFRIFNPITQGEKFDKDGRYVRQWVPEIAELPDKYLHKPWEAPEEILDAAGITLGDTYPPPIVDHREARQGALDAYDTIKGKG